MDLQDQDQRVAEFLETVRTDRGEEVQRVCQELIAALPHDGEFRPFSILSEALHKLQEPNLHNLGAMNATPFNSAQD